jgi:hypothetical protein
MLTTNPKGDARLGLIVLEAPGIVIEKFIFARETGLGALIFTLLFNTLLYTACGTFVGFLVSIVAEYRKSDVLGRT